jgi:8-oxo-dGTP diphosphatase
MKFYLAVKGIIRKGDEILVLKRSEIDNHKPGVWETIGGGIDAEISPEESLRREIREEAGIEVDIIKPFRVFTFRKDTGEFKVGITFICDYISGEVKLSGEHSDYKWIKPAEFEKLESIPSLYEEIKLYAEKNEE